MTMKRIKKLLEDALIHDGKMEHALYEFELKSLLDEFRSSMAEDNDDYFFAITENRGHVAMVLIEKTGETHINESARDRLKELWLKNYTGNIKKTIPDFAKQLNDGEIPVTGVKTIRTMGE